MTVSVGTNMNINEQVYNLVCSKVVGQARKSMEKNRRRLFVAITDPLYADVLFIKTDIRNGIWNQLWGEFP